MKNNKIFLYAIFSYFVLCGSFHFICLMLDWSIEINGRIVPSFVSGTFIILSVLVVYWIKKIVLKNKIKIEKIEKEIEKNN